MCACARRRLFIASLIPFQIAIAIQIAHCRRHRFCQAFEFVPVSVRSTLGSSIFSIPSPRTRWDNGEQFRIQLSRRHFMEIYSAPFVIESGDNNDVKNDDFAMVKEERNLRFSGVGRLYAQDIDNREVDYTRVALSVSDLDTSTDKDNMSRSSSSHLDVVERLAASTVAVVGLGGVGSWAAEALCRSGVGSLILVDLDDICVSNTNRQLHAMSSTVGSMKVDEMKRRLLDINPQCNVTNILDFITPENVDELMDSLLPELDVCLDAIDGHREKAALIASCATRGVPIVTCGGSAGRKDPSQIVCDDITVAQECRLLFKCRKNLRQTYGFRKGPGQGQKNYHKVKPWNILAVYSNEKQKSVSPREERDGASSFRRCDGALGTACFVTGTYGFVAAGRVVDMIANGKYIRPTCV